MEIMETSREDLEASERDFARKLQEQVAEWKTLRSPARTRTAAGVRVERRFRRRPGVTLLSACERESYPPSDRLDLSGLTAHLGVAETGEVPRAVRLRFRTAVIVYSRRL